jgi:hypothetical protein
VSPGHRRVGRSGPSSRGWWWGAWALPGGGSTLWPSAHARRA